MCLQMNRFVVSLAVAMVAATGVAGTNGTRELVGYLKELER